MDRRRKGEREGGREEGETSLREVGRKGRGPHSPLQSCKQSWNTNHNINRTCVKFLYMLHGLSMNKRYTYSYSVLSTSVYDGYYSHKQR